MLLCIAGWRAVLVDAGVDVDVDGMLMEQI